MSAANCAEELDFRLIFEEDGRTAGPEFNVRTPPSSTQALAEQLTIQELQSHPPCFPHQHPGYQAQGPQYGAQGNPRTFDCPSIQITSIAPNSHVEPCGSQEALAVGGAEGGYPEASWSRGQLYLPLDPCYRDPALCPSPCSSLSSRSWMSDISSCESFSHVYDDVDGELRDAARLALGSPVGSPVGSPGCGGGAFGVELWQQKYQHPLAFSPALSPHQSPRQSPCHSPRTSVTEESWLNRRPTSRPSSRPSSPCGKRRHSGADPRTRSPSPHHSPSPTPGTSPRGSVTDETWVGSPAGALGALLMSGYQELDVPSKTRRTSGTQLGLLAGQGETGLEPFLDSPGEEGRDQDDLAELFLQVPSHFSWNKPQPGNPPLFRTSSPPPLDWPLPPQFDQCELKVEVQPRSYHRAHYETEGSRGSIKASAGHPVVRLLGPCQQPLSLLLFIGTADERCLRPHSFYQVHRVTGKTVTTCCQERLLGGTKVLEVPLLPQDNMSASIDCAGILKLRNADIELKKGELDIGRKNTRVRVVFRVAVPQSDGRMLWLQTSSNPVECSQRSGQELPQVDSFSPACCSVDGGDELLVTGSNISAQSRVVFLQKGPDGRTLWEMDARVLSEKSSGSSIVVEVPPYDKKTAEPVQVQFYVSNGKRRRSLTQSLTLLPVVQRLLPAPRVKQETDYTSHNAPDFSTDMLYYDCDIPVHCGPPYQSAPRLHHPHTSSLPPHSSSLLPQSSSLPPHSSSLPPHTSPLSPHTSFLPPHTSPLSPQTSPLPPHSSSLSPHTSPLSPHTSFLPPHTSPLSPQTSPLPPHSSSLSPHTSSLPPHSSSLPPHTSSLPPQTSSLPPHTSSLSPQTSSLPPYTSSLPPQTSSLPPHTSSLSPQTSSLPPYTSSLPPHSSSLPPHTSSLLPQSSSLPPQTSSLLPQSSSLPPQSSSLPPQTSSLPPYTSSLPPHTSSLPPHSSSLPPHSPPLLPHTSSLPPHSSSLPHHSSSLPPHTSSLPPHSSSLPPHSSSLPPHSPPLLPHTSSLPPHSSSLPHHSSSLPPHTSPLPPHTSSLPPYSSSLPPLTSPLLPQTSSLPPHSSSMPPHSSSLPPQTSSLPPHTSSLPPHTSSLPPHTSSQDESPLSSPDEAPSIKQEQEDGPGLGSLGIQEITLDDVNEIIHRDIRGLTSSTQDHFEHFYQFDQ